jgi:chorismate mutase
MTDEIEALRGRIEELDSAVIRLLGERFAHVRLLARYKDRAGLPIEDAEREDELCALHRAGALREGLSPALVQAIFAAVLEHSRAEQHAQVRRPKTA